MHVTGSGDMGTQGKVGIKNYIANKRENGGKWEVESYVCGKEMTSACRSERLHKGTERYVKGSSGMRAQIKIVNIRK